MVEDVDSLDDSNQDERRPKVRFILQDSDHKDTGLVVDCSGSVPGDAELLKSHKNYEVIGTWNRLSCGIVVEITTTIEARQDVLINLVKNLSESYRGSSIPLRPLSERWKHTYSERDYGSQIPVSRTERRKSKSLQPSQSQQDSDIDSRYNKMRDLLRRNTQ